MTAQEKQANTLTDKEKACYYRRFSGAAHCMESFIIDAFEFCRLRERREGEIAVADLPRLASESVNGVGIMRWSLEGGAEWRGNPQLRLFVEGEVQLACQRCLKPFQYAIHSDAMLVLARDEESADELDALLADEPVEVVVGSVAFDVRQLIEDEALLAIPLSPKHEICPDQEQELPKSESAEEKVSPFAVLRSLKK